MQVCISLLQLADRILAYIHGPIILSLPARQLHLRIEMLEESIF